MTEMDWNPDAGLAALRRLTERGTLGFYTRVEATEIIAFPPEKQPPVNVLTLLVAEEAPDTTAADPAFVNPDRIAIAGLRDWRFGILRYTISMDRIIPVFEQLATLGTWDASGDALRHGVDKARPPQFVPPDAVQEIPWNRVLKNNFWNGSYVVEWADTTKANLAPLFASPHQMQALSKAIQAYIPISLASLSDRWGNIVLQLPVTVLMARFGGQQDGTVLLETGWHPHATQRPLRALVELEFDCVITGYQSVAVEGERALLPLLPGPGTHRGSLWDDANGLMLAATGPSAFIRTIAMNLQPITPEPRVFSLPDEDGGWHPQRVKIHETLKSLVGPSENDANEGWTRRRMYRDETARLVQERRFVQYRPQSGHQAVEHQRALGDIRYLISLYGEEGAWLWDPYLSAVDILKTLFFSPHHGADLRALTAQGESPCKSSNVGARDFKQRQVETFARTQSNFYGLKIEYRARSGSSGWAFHDRFLIFPRRESGALAWSLGTSVNSVGKAHHILQRVDDGQQVMDAFVELWNELQGPDNLIWKTPVS